MQGRHQTLVATIVAAGAVRAGAKRRGLLIVGRSKHGDNAGADRGGQMHGAGVVGSRRRSADAITPASVARSVRPQRFTTDASRATSRHADSVAFGADSNGDEPCLGRAGGTARRSARTGHCFARPYAAPGAKTTKRVAFSDAVRRRAGRGRPSRRRGGTSMPANESPTATSSDAAIELVVLDLMSIAPGARQRRASADVRANRARCPTARECPHARRSHAARKELGSSSAASKPPAANRVDVGARAGRWPRRPPPPSSTTRVAHAWHHRIERRHRRARSDDNLRDRPGAMKIGDQRQRHHRIAQPIRRQNHEPLRGRHARRICRLHDLSHPCTSCTPCTRSCDPPTH